MGAPFGNTNAAGSDYDLNDEARALDEWSKRDDALALVDFTTERDIWPQRIYEWRDKSPLYADVLKKVKGRIASRQRKLLHENKYNYGLFMREIAFHDPFLHMFEDGEKDKDAKRAKSIEEVKVDELKLHMTAFLDMIKAVQPAQQSSVRSDAENKADTSISVDSKS